MSQRMNRHHQPPKTIVFLGGSFDPIHIGHLWMAEQVMQTLRAVNLDAQYNVALHVMPTPLSPLKQTRTSTRHRVAMLRRALRDTPFLLEDTELRGMSPASSIDTFHALRLKYGNAVSFIFVIGQDSLETLPMWKGGFDLLKQTHLWIFPRAVSTAEIQPLQLPAAIQPQQVTNAATLLMTTAGHVFLDTRTPPHVSSTYIRANIVRAQHLVPKRVFAYSMKAKLYGSNP